MQETYRQMSKTIAPETDRNNRDKVSIEKQQSERPPASAIKLSMQEHCQLANEIQLMELTIQASDQPVLLLQQDSVESSRRRVSLDSQKAPNDHIVQEHLKRRNPSLQNSSVKANKQNLTQNMSQATIKSQLSPRFRDGASPSVSSRHGSDV